MMLIHSKTLRHLRDITKKWSIMHLVYYMLIDNYMYISMFEIVDITDKKFNELLNKCSLENSM